MIKSVYTQETSPAQAAAALRQQLGGFETRFLIAFASSAYDQAALATALRESFPEASIIGCSTAGEIVSGHMLQNSLVAMAFSPAAIDDLKIEVVQGLKAGASIDAAMEAFGAHFGTPVSQLDYRKYVGLVLIDGLTLAEENLMEALGDRSNVTFIGASAGDDLKFTQTFVYADGQVYSDAAVLALLKPAVEFDFIKTQSFCASAKQLVPTKVDRASRTVYEFNGQPAASAYAEALGVSVEELPNHFMSNPVGLMDGNEPFVRSPMQLKDDAVAFYCNVHEGMELAVLEPLDIVADTRQALAAKQQEVGHISGIIDFHCILRTLQLRNEGRTGEYGQIFTDVPTVGFSTYGEEFITHVNQTSTMLVFK